MHSSKSDDYLIHKGVLVDEVGFTVWQGKINIF